MKKSNTFLRVAITSLAAVSSAAIATAAFAADEHADQEQCAGVIKAGKNDCATAKNACHGHVTTNKDPMAWIYVPKGTCDRISGAHIVSVVDPSPKKT